MVGTGESLHSKAMASPLGRTSTCEKVKALFFVQLFQVVAAYLGVTDLVRM